MKHHVTSTIHAAMEDTHQRIKTEIYQINVNYNCFDKGQMIVVLIRTKLDKNTIFVGGGTILLLK